MAIIGFERICDMRLRILRSIQRMDSVRVRRAAEDFLTLHHDIGKKLKI